MKDPIHINELIELEAIADLLQEKAAKLKRKCAQAREKMTGVSTPVLKGKVDPKVIASVIARRNKTMIKR